MDLFDMVLGSVCLLLLSAVIFFLPDERVIRETGLSAKVIYPGIFCLLAGDWNALPLNIGNSLVLVKVGSIAVPIVLGCCFLFALQESALQWRSFLLGVGEFILLLLGDGFLAAQVHWYGGYLFWGLLLISTVAVATLLRHYGAFLGVHLITLPMVFVVQGLWQARVTHMVSIGGGTVLGMLGVSVVFGVAVIYLLQLRTRQHFMEQVLAADK